MRITLRIAFHELATKLADVEEGFADHDARLPLSASDDVDAEVRKTMDVLEGIEDVGGGTVAPGEPPRLLDDLGVRIGLTFWSSYSDVLGAGPGSAAPMGLTLIEAAIGCVEPAEIRLEQLVTIKTFTEGELFSGQSVTACD